MKENQEEISGFNSAGSSEQASLRYSSYNKTP